MSAGSSRSLQLWLTMIVAIGVPITSGRLLADGASDKKPAIPTQAAGQRLMATKIAGLVMFVANSCPHLRPNYKQFDQALRALGTSKADLDQPETKNAYLSYAAAYGRDAAANCAKADSEFGAQGKTLPGLFDQHL